MKRYFPIRELADVLDFEVVGKLKRLPDRHYGLYGHYPCYVDEAGNEYCPNLIGDVSCGCIVEPNGRVH